MKKIITIILLIMVFSLCCVSCKGKAGEVSFGSSDLLTSSFDGLGVEWGTYEDTNKMIKGSWPRVLSAVDRLNPSLVRCMTNLDWFVVDFDDKGTNDLSDDDWSYNFNNKQMANASDVLDYCQKNGIKVAFGVWNVIGKADPEEDVIKMISGDVTADPRWAKMCSDLMEYLIVKKGYTCIRWFVNTNEPNILGREGSSKNYNNTKDKWIQGVKNLRKAFDDIGLKDLSIIGGDTTTLAGSRDYLTYAADKIPDLLDNYGVHLYVNYNDIASAKYQKELLSLYSDVADVDKELGSSKNMYIWEAGLLWGKDPDRDCNDYIMDFAYGLCMADYTVQSIFAGVNGIVYWDLDDAMHFMYRENETNAKEWGMFSTLATADSDKQEYRYWYHSSVLLTNLLRPGYALYGKSTGINGVRALAAVSPDKTKGGFVVVNNSKTKASVKMSVVDEVNGGDKLYVYYYNESMLKIGSDGFVTPNKVIDGDLNRELNLDVPANTMVVVSNVKL